MPELLWAEGVGRAVMQLTEKYVQQNRKRGY